MPDWICPTEVTDVHSGYRTTGRPDHVGIDLGALWGQPIVAPRAGVVVWVGDEPGGAGLHVNINHDDAGVQTRYFHMAEIWVERGQWVEQAQTIGLVGTTGGVAQHLHYEMRALPNLEPFDPTPYMTPWFASGIPVGVVLGPVLPDPELLIDSEGDDSVTSCTGRDGTFVFVVGYQESVWVNRRDPETGAWSGWTDLGGIVRDPVEVNADKAP